MISKRSAQRAPASGDGWARFTQARDPVICLHGFLGSGRNLGALARTWCKRSPERRMLLVDLLGHGRSPPLPPHAGLEAMAESVLALLETEDIPRPVDLVGHSLGGRVALQARMLDESRIGRIVLLDIGPGPILSTETEGVLQTLLAAPDRAPSREAMRNFLVGSGLSRPLAEWLLMNGSTSEGEGFTWRIERSGLAHFHEKMRAADLWPAVETNAETFLIRGERSNYVSEGELQRFRAALVPVQTIEDAGHFLHVDQTEAVANELRAALG